MLVEKTIGIIFFFIGLSLFIRGEDWKNVVFKLNNPVFYPILGVLFLSLGSFLVVFLHDNWMESYRSVILIVLGYLMLIKALLLLFLPKQVQGFFNWALEQHQALYRIEATFYIIIGLTLFIQ